MKTQDKLLRRFFNEKIRISPSQNFEDVEDSFKREMANSISFAHFRLWKARQKLLHEIALALGIYGLLNYLEKWIKKMKGEWRIIPKLTKKLSRQPRH